MDVATQTALNTTVGAIATTTKIGTTLVIRAADSTKLIHVGDIARQNVQVEEVAIAQAQALGVLYRRNRRTVNVIVRAFILYVFLNILSHIVLALIHFALFCLFILFLVNVLPKLSLSSRMT